MAKFTMVNVFALIEAGHYESKIPYEAMPPLEPHGEDETPRQFKARKEAYVEERRARNKRASDAAGHAEHRFYVDCCIACMEAGLTLYQASRAYSLAWDQGHSSGFHDVACHLDDAIELFQPSKPDPQWEKRISADIEARRKELEDGQ